MLNKKKFLISVETNKYKMIDLSQSIKISKSKIILNFSSNLYRQNSDIYQHMFLLESVYKSYKKNKGSLKIDFPYLKFKEELLINLSTLLKITEYKGNVVIIESDDINNDLSIIKNIIERDSYLFLKSLYKRPIIQLNYENKFVEGYYSFTLDWIFIRVNILNKKNLSKNNLKKLTNNLNFIANKINNSIKLKLSVGSIDLFPVKYFNEVEKIFKEVF